MDLRKIILINKKFQLSLIGWIVILGIIIEVIFYGANLYFFKHMNDQAILAGLTPDNVFFEYLNNQKSFMNKVFLISTLISAVTIFWVGLYLSHKVAGPLARLTQHLNNSKVSTVTPLKFRQGDYFPEIETAFNEFIEKK